ncbi:MAG TPA: ABC transporter substrate-binding protein [Candidatus Rifleibacterium sp.]|nr:ABC transporter substrate-binding protein [Candidatus Rifleibacterium sp.]HPT46352.1 ABC transporter substrate-binding protein [Candidatus Rifleibacterium sp.]
MKMPAFITRAASFFKRFDIYQILAVPVLLAIVLFSIDFDSASLKIGVILPVSGAYSQRAQNHLNGLTLAARHINELGGINGHQISLELRDTRGQAEQTAEVTRDLIYDLSVTALIGGFSPANTRIIQEMAEKAQIPFITAICTHFEVTTSGSRFTFRSVTDDRRQFEALAEYAVKRFNSRKPALIYDLELYSPDSAQKFIEICSRLGQQVCAAISFRRGTLNFRRQIETIMAANPDSLTILAPADDSAMILRQFREARFSQPIFGGNQLAASEFMNLAGVYSEAIVTTLPFNPRAGGQRADYFLSEYAEIFDQPADADAAMGYEAMMLLALALKSGDTDRVTVRNALAALHGWESVAGSGGFDDDGNQVRPAEIAIIKDRQKIPVTMEELF